MLNIDILLVVLGRPLLIDSDYIQKIKNNEEQSIEMDLEYNRADRYDLTQTLYEMSLELD